MSDIVISVNRIRNDFFSSIMRKVIQFCYQGNANINIFSLFVAPKLKLLCIQFFWQNAKLHTLFIAGKDSELNKLINKDTRGNKHLLWSQTVKQRKWEHLHQDFKQTGHMDYKNGKEWPLSIFGSFCKDNSRAMKILSSIFPSLYS